MLTGAFDKVNSKFRASVEQSCLQALERVGFHHYKKEWADYPFCGDFHGWVGLNSGLYPTHVEISPFVGLHAPRLMKLYFSLQGEKYRRSTATYSIHMGELAPDVDAFMFALDTDIEAEADRLAQLYVTVGMNYARSIASYEALMPLLQERVPMLGGYPERVAVCQYLMGRSNEARDFVLAKQAEYKSASLVVQESFDKFAVPFLAMLTQ